MMYANKMAVAIKTNGRVLREHKDTVFVKFGSEYSVYMKNLNTTRAVVNVFIDGNNITPSGLVIDPGQEVDLERSIANGNLKEGNALKFIERTGKIEHHRGISAEDGLIRVEYQFEMPRLVTNISDNNFWKQYPPGVRGNEFWNNHVPTSSPTFNVGGTLRSVDWSKNGEITAQAATTAINNYCADNGIQNKSEIHDGMATCDSFMNEVGITVPGSKSEQKFQTTTVGALDPTIHNIVLRIVGDLGNNKPVDKPITVNHKPRCQTCGHTNKATAQYCNKCGTALEIFA